MAAAGGHHGTVLARTALVCLLRLLTLQLRRMGAKLTFPYEVCAEDLALPGVAALAMQGDVLPSLRQLGRASVHRASTTA